MSMEVNRTGAVAAPTLADAGIPEVMVSGSAEAVVAQASLLLEEAGERSRSLERSQQRERSSERRAALEDKAKASVLKLVGTTIEAGISAAAGVASIAGASDTFATVAKPLGQLANASLGFAAEEQSLQAEGRGIAADEHQAIAESSRADADRATRLAERAMSHMEQMQQAKHQAAMAALRG
ncbi:MAG: hypothetical protein H6721_32155 [Sandaracinus sp.]|nr:hypothetical protein [Sandaracinus sp.]